MIDRPRAILFDLDGVLIDSYWVWFHLLNQTARELGYPEISDEVYRTTWGQSTTADRDAFFPRHEVAEIEAFYDENLGAARARLYVAGQFSSRAMRAAIEDAFGDWKEGPPPTIDIPEPVEGRAVYLLDRKGAPQSTINLGIPAVDPSSDYYVTFQVMHSLLGGSFASRITRNIREDKGYTYSPFSSVSVRYRDGYWIQSADVSTEVTGAALDDYLRYVLTLPHTPGDEGYQRLAASPPERLVMTDAFFSDGTLGVMSTALLKPEAKEGLQRFARVFEQTYTRFLDLQKAEEQAREAQIEAALERVRAKAMAMHNSSDLSDATAIVFTELEKLGISTLRCGIVIIHENKQADLWTATATAEEKDVRVIGRLDMTIHPALEGVFEAWKKQQPCY